MQRINLLYNHRNHITILHSTSLRLQLHSLQPDLDFALYEMSMLTLCPAPFPLEAVFLQKCSWLLLWVLPPLPLLIRVIVTTVLTAE